jgi:hypothetical protein
MRFGVIFLLFVFGGINAQNSLRIFSANGRFIDIYKDTKKINHLQEASVLLPDIEEDSIMLSIELDELRINYLFYLLDKKLRTNKKEFNYKVENNKGQLVISYVCVYDAVNLPNPLVPEKPVVDTSNKYKNIVLGHYCEIKNKAPEYFNNLPEKKVCVDAMPSEYINYMKILLKSAQVADDKFLITENTIRNNCLNTQQVFEIINEIEYEIDKLKLVKLAYYQLTDKDNLKNVEKAFRFESSIKEFNLMMCELKNTKEIKSGQCTKVSDTAEISSYKNIIKAYNSDAEKFSVLKKTYQNYCYSSNDISDLLSLFIHDREKLDVAKLLYFYCIDKNSYPQLTTHFSYKESENSLINFLEKQGNK